MMAVDDPTIPTAAPEPWPEPRRSRRRRQRPHWQPSNRVIFYTLIAFCVLTLGLIQVVSSTLSGKIDDGQAASNAGRAALCQELYDIGEDVHAIPACTQPAVAPLIDTGHPPTAGANSPGQIRNVALLCSILQRLDQPDPLCAQVTTTTH